MWTEEFQIEHVVHVKTQKGRSRVVESGGTAYPVQRFDYVVGNHNYRIRIHSMKMTASAMPLRRIEQADMILIGNDLRYWAAANARGDLMRLKRELWMPSLLVGH